MPPDGGMEEEQVPEIPTYLIQSVRQYICSERQLYSIPGSGDSARSS